MSVVTLEGNTPKRHTRSTRHSKHEEQTKLFSPVASSMVVTPVAQHVKQKNKIRVKQKRNKKTIPMVVTLVVWLLLALLMDLSLALCADEKTIFTRTKRKVQTGICQEREKTY